MNRRSANSLESDDSGSDWDTTIVDSPIHLDSSKMTAPVAYITDTNDEYARMTPKSHLGPKDADLQNSSGSANRKSADYVPKKEMSQTKGGSQLMSPPPHMTSFQNVLSDYAVVHDVAPDIPSRGYEGKGKLYTVPESDSFTSPQPSLDKWDDSDAEERVLKELQKNLMKDKQRHQITTRDKKVTLAGIDKINVTAENHGYVSSPIEARSSESVVQNWPRKNEVKFGKNTDKTQKCITVSGDISSPSHFQPPSHSVDMTPPMVAKDFAGKKCIFYFEEGNPHFMEVEEDDVNAYLPPKIDEIEKIFRRVWREVFAVLRIATSVFVLFVAELILFLAHHLVRPLILDSITAIGDYVLKPFLALLFNAIIQPIFALLWNIFNATYQATEPLVKLLGYILMQVAIVLKAFRLFVIQWNSSSGYRQEIEVV